ncbi:MAG: protein kinase [Clostridia bacterium]|nr:protein kinase [Clostridia bacterium]
MVINGYTLTTELNNANSGFSKWGFATKNGREYFIKELITPVYPMDEGVMSPELLKSRRDYCLSFENRYRTFYNTLNKAGYGSLVRIVEFFRCDSRYYVVTEKVAGDTIPANLVSTLSVPDKYLLIKSIAFAFFWLHRANIIHFDVKPSNIMIKRTRTGKYTGKLIDFDAGFFKNEPREDVELGGDLTYLAPETFLAMAGEQVTLTEKTDIFSLGLVFHELFAGFLPYFDQAEYDYPFEAVLNGGELTVNNRFIPPAFGELIMKMLSVNPEDRPSSEEIIQTLATVSGAGSFIPPETPPDVPEPEPVPGRKEMPKVSSGWFHTAGDL